MMPRCVSGPSGRRIVVTTLLLLAAGGRANAALRAWVDEPQVAPGETLELNLAHDGQTQTQPDLAPLRQDFDIVGRSSSANVQIINGAASSTTQLTLTLAPKRAGHLTVPALTWDGDRSAPLAVNVGAASNGAAGTSRVFLQTQIDPKSPYVQAAVHVTVSVYAAVPLSHADLEFPASDAALVREVGADTTSTAERNGQSYQVVTRHYLVFPQHSGHLSIPGPTLSGNVPASARGGHSNDPFAQFFGNDPFAGMLKTTKPIRLSGESIELDVQPRPPGAGASYWIPAQDVQLSAQWRPQQLQAHTGDPVTVTLHLQAEDLTAAQLPDLSTLLRLPDGLKAYPDEPQLKDAPSGNGVLGKRDQSIALIADQPGHFTIPELRLSWWDTRSNQERQAILPSQTLSVTPAPGSQSVTVPRTQQPAAATSAPLTLAPPHNNAITAQSTGERAIWKWISLGIGVLWLLTLTAWFLTQRRRGEKPAARAPEPSAAAPGKSAARAAFLSACARDDAHAARQNLLAWANAAFPAQRVPGLSALAKVIGDPAVEDLLRALDRACYAGESWRGAPLAEALRKWPPRAAKAAVEEPELAPLYR
jgi:hypothetical protein